jgi:hypothetical protein
MKKLTLALVASALATTTLAEEPKELLSKMRAAYESAKSAKFRVNITRLQPNGEINILMDAEFAAPNLYRASVTTNGMKDFELWCDGKKITAVDSASEAKDVVDYGIDPLGERIPGNLESISFFDWKRQLNMVDGNMKGNKLTVYTGREWGGKKWTVLEEVVADQPIDVDYYVDPTTHLIWRTVVRARQANRTIIDCKILKLDLNVPVDPKRFAHDGNP